MLSTDLSARPTGGVLDVATGEFVARAALTVAGNYTIWARLGATAHVRGSPFHVLVTAAPFSAASSTAAVPYVWTAGAAQTIGIVARDAFGNAVSDPSAFPDGCAAACGAVRFSAVLRPALRTAVVDKGAVAAAGGTTHFTLASSADAFPGAYVGFSVDVNGETRNITHHGAAQGASTAQGRVVTVNAAFSAAAPALGDPYYVTRVQTHVAQAARVCRVTQGAGAEYAAACPGVRETGEYLLELRSSGTALKDSPHRFAVQPSWKCASTSSVAGAGLTLATAGAAATFTIQTRDSHAQLTTRGGDSFAIFADRRGAITPIEWFSYCAPSLAAPRTECVASTVGIGTQTVADRDTGAYAVSITPTRAGHYRVSVLLGNTSPLRGSPYDLYVSAGAVCAAQSHARGAGLTLATAGLQARFTVDARDSYSNPVGLLNLGTQDCAVGGAAGPCLLSVTVGTESWTVAPRDSGLAVRPAEERHGAGWDVAYTLAAQSGGGELATSLSVGGAAVGNPTSGGLFATYYSDVAFASPMVIREDAAVDFSGTGVAHSAGPESLYREWPWRGLFEASASSTLLADAAFAVRWTGRIAPVLNATYTFGAALGSETERVKLWVENELVIDQWASLGARRPEGTFAFQRGALAPYSVTVEYKQPEAAAARLIRLGWAAGGARAVQVPSSALLRTRDSFSTRVEQHAPSAPLQSSASGDGLSLLTAGSYGYFTVTARDSLGLARDVTASQRLLFSAIAGVDAGGLAATYYATQVRRWCAMPRGACCHNVFPNRCERTLPFI